MAGRRLNGDAGETVTRFLSHPAAPPPCISFVRSVNESTSLFIYVNLAETRATAQNKLIYRYFFRRIFPAPRDVRSLKSGKD